VSDEVPFFPVGPTSNSHVQSPADDGEQPGWQAMGSHTYHRAAPGTGAVHTQGWGGPNGPASSLAYLCRHRLTRYGTAIFSRTRSAWAIQWGSMVVPRV
jgi:hypothetical protein